MPSSYSSRGALRPPQAPAAPLAGPALSLQGPSGTEGQAAAAGGSSAAPKVAQRPQQGGVKPALVQGEVQEAGTGAQGGSSVPTKRMRH